MKSYEEEIFGPVLSVLTFDDKEDMIRRANNTFYGLSAGVWTQKGSRILKMAKDLKMIMMPEITRVVFIDGEPAAVSLGIPNLNEVVKSFKGKLNPITAVKLMWWLFAAMMGMFPIHQ